MKAEGFCLGTIDLFPNVTRHTWEDFAELVPTSVPNQRAVNVHCPGKSEEMRADNKGTKNGR